MLVLSRKRDQRIMIGNNVRLTVVDVRGDTVQLGIEAPKEIPVYREEIYKSIQEANQNAALDQKMPKPEELGKVKPMNRKPK
ncbi:carbon storage regulator CsrA [bacterium]|nr:carbon storage regulator CsrA [bacterium]